MAQFDKIDGVFSTRLPDGRSGIRPNERFQFINAGWTWNRVRKGWETADVDKAIPLEKLATGAAKEALEASIAARRAAIEASWAETTDKTFPAPDGLHYLPFQEAGIEYALARDNTLIADSMGLGKTVQAIGVHNASGTEKVLIVCPASLKVNWKREWEKWDVHKRSVGIAGSKTVREKLFDENGERMRDPNTKKPMTQTRTEHVWPDTDVVIVNYDMLDAFDGAIKAVEWDLLICDEVHLLKTATTTRSRCVFGGFRRGSRKTGKKSKTYTKIQAKRKLLLTGTPILSKPAELWTIVKACDPKGLGKSYDDFVFQYCGAYYIGNHLDTTGASNVEELNQKLRERFMIRRDKKAVLSELPDKTRELVVLPKDKLEAPIRKEKSRVEEALKAYEDIIGIDSENIFRYIDMLSDKLQAAVDNLGSEMTSWDDAVKTLDEPDQILFTQISEAREEVALAKVGLVVEHTTRILNTGEPVILFGYHKSVLAEIEKRLTKVGISVGTITGDVPPNSRQEIVDQFQNGKIDVILGNILAMGVGFTLTRARFVVFAELDWVPAMIEQAEDRAWRIGQKNSVVVQHLVVEGSIESRMATALLEKMGVIKEVLDVKKCS